MYYVPDGTEQCGYYEFKTKLYMVRHDFYKF